MASISLSAAGSRVRSAMIEAIASAMTGQPLVRGASMLTDAAARASEGSSAGAIRRASHGSSVGSGAPCRAESLNSCVISTFIIKRSPVTH